MKKYTDRIDELKKSQSEMTMEEFLRDDRKCTLEGETPDGRQIWSCNSAGAYKVVENGRFKVQFNEVKYFDFVGNELISLEGGPIKTIDYRLMLASVPNLKGFAKTAKNITLSSMDELTSLEGLPRNIEGNLDINFCPKLTSLKGIPEHVGGKVVITHTGITNLDHFPKYVGGNIEFKKNKLTSLVGLPKAVNGALKIIGEKYLTSLEGCSEYVETFFSLDETDNLESYNGFPQNEPREDWHGSNGPADIETEFILNSRYKDNFGFYGDRATEFSKKYYKEHGEHYDFKQKDDDEPRYVDYWAELLEYILREDKTKITTVKWPKEFIEKQTDEVKSLMQSSAGLRKFNIDQ